MPHMALIPRGLTANFAGAAVLASLLILPVLITPGCRGESAEPTAAPEVEWVRGLILEVQAASLTELESLMLQDEMGQTWNFQAQGQRLQGFTPSHLREHMVGGEQVTVKFRREGDRLVLLDVLD